MLRCGRNGGGGNGAPASGCASTMAASWKQFTWRYVSVNGATALHSPALGGALTWRKCSGTADTQSRSRNDSCTSRAASLTSGGGMISQQRAVASRSSGRKSQNDSSGSSRARRWLHASS